MFTTQSDHGYDSPIEGIEKKTLVYGEKSLLTEFRLEGRRDLPQHAHPQEQTGYLVSGHMRLTIGDETFDVRPGDSWCVPGDVVHGAQIVEDSVAVEVFAPVREDYLPDDAKTE